MDTIIYTKEEILLNYLNASNEKGGWVSHTDISFERAGMIVSHGVFTKRFGTIENTRRLVIEKFPNLIKFDINKTKEQIVENSDELLDMFISKSLEVGKRLSAKQIEDDEDLPSIAFIIACFGSMADFRKLASNKSEAFAELPARNPSIPRDTLILRKKRIAEQYIETCLEGKGIIPATPQAFEAEKFPFSPTILRDYFGSIPAFREYCAKLNPEFAELLANAPKAIRK